MSDWQHFAHGADIGAQRRDAGLQLSMVTQRDAACRVMKPRAAGKAASWRMN